MDERYYEPRSYKEQMERIEMEEQGLWPLSDIPKKDNFIIPENRGVLKALKVGCYAIWVGLIHSVLKPTFLYPTYSRIKDNKADYNNMAGSVLCVWLISLFILFATWIAAFGSKKANAPWYFFLGMLAPAILFSTTNSLSALYELGRENLKNEKPPLPPIEPA